MPVSKKRKKKPVPPPTKKAAPPASKLSRQKILIYIISIVMILSLALGYILGNSGPAPVPTVTPLPVNSGIVTPASEEQAGEQDAPEDEAGAESDGSEDGGAN